MTVLRSVALVIAEKVGVTFAYQFLIVLVGSGAAGLVGVSAWGTAADTAGFVALVTLVTAVIQVLLKLNPAGVLGVVTRVALSGLQSFAGTLAASRLTSLVHIGWSGALAAALAVMAASAAKNLIALQLPTVGSSLVPLRAVHPRVVEYAPEHLAA